jgi:hypothetical protein
LGYVRALRVLLNVRIIVVRRIVVPVQIAAGHRHVKRGIGPDFIRARSVW